MKKIRLSSCQVGISLLATQIDKVIKKELQDNYPTDDITWEITLKVKK